MFDSTRELIDKIRLGEDSVLELKEVRFSNKAVSSPDRESLADDLAAFANSYGGVCVLGVEDDTGEVLGIPLDRLSVLQSFIEEVCNDLIDPPLSAKIESLELPTTMGHDVAVIKVDVPSGPYVYRSPGGHLLRVGSSKRLMRPEHLSRLSAKRGRTTFLPFDEEIINAATISDLSLDLLDRFRTLNVNVTQTNLLLNLHMATKDAKGVIRPTVAGILMATNDPRQWLPNAFIQAVAYRGIDIDTTFAGYQQDAADITGPLDHQVKNACAFVTKNMWIMASKNQGRVDRPQFDLMAVFEAVVNAVAHRDYSIHGSKIRLRIFDDRLEIYSPGNLPNAMGVESLRDLQSTRNEVIYSLLAKCPLPTNQDQTRVEWLDTERKTIVEKRGEGVHIILDNSKKLSDREPEYRLIEDRELLLTIFGASATL